jgi:tRNA pseudouridine38-40 synthase
MRFLKLTLAYDGTAYAGWQVQPDQRTLQGTLEEALRRVTGETIRAVASGRTDAGVHAIGQVVSVATACRLPPGVLRAALNANLPDDMAVCEVAEARPGFHAVRDAIRKRYRYVIQDGPIRDVFSRRFAWQVWQRLDAAAMHRAARTLLGAHDFSSFEASGSRRATSVRTVTDISVQRCRSGHAEHIVVDVEADGFLYNMVRNIVGVLVEVGRGVRTTEWPADVLAAKRRAAAGVTAPAHGLFLVKVDYPF